MSTMKGDAHKGAAEPLDDLELLIRSRYGLIVVETIEEDRAEGLLGHLADRLSLPLFSWTRTKGLRRVDSEASVYGTTDPATALDHLEQSSFPAVYHLRGFGEHLADPVLAGKLTDVAAAFEDRSGAVILTGVDVALPAALAQRTAVFRLPPPRLEDYRDLLQHIVRDISARSPVDIELAPRDLAQLLNNLKGLTLLEAEKVLTRAIVEDGKLSPDDVRDVIEAKRAIVEREGVLEYYPVEATLADVADFATLKAWLARRRAVIAAPEKAAEYGLEFPKGLLLVGVPGCGKSLCAKAVAMEWALPLLKLDPSSLYNKYIGQSEQNFLRATKTAERMAPVVLWIDELEKAFATGGEDGGVSARILGTFLSWLQDRKGDVFVVATANDVTRLPPEFLRKGRFDEIFFVDLPDAEARRALLWIHLRKRNQDPAAFDLDALARATDGFSGAEVEQVIVSGLYTAFAAQGPLTDELLLDEISRTRPLSVTMAERIAALRQWAKGRTISAH